MWMRCHKIDWGNLAAALKKRGKKQSKKGKRKQKKTESPQINGIKSSSPASPPFCGLTHRKKYQVDKTSSEGSSSRQTKATAVAVSAGTSSSSCFFVSYSPFSFCRCLGFSFVLLSRLAQSMQIAHTTRWRKVASRQPTMSPKIEPNNKWEELWAKQVDLGIPFKEFLFLLLMF